MYHCCLFRMRSFSLAFFAVLLSSTLFGQSYTNMLPMVTVKASDPFASRTGDTGTFTFLRHGNTNADLNLYFTIGGTASNGVDYVEIPQTVTIPAGHFANSVTITPIDNGETDAVQTVAVHLVYPPTMPPINYMIGFADRATVYIGAADVTNVPPVVRITGPANGAVFRAPVDIPLFAFAADRNGVVTNVEFFADATSLGSGKPVSMGGAMGMGSMFFLVWSNAPLGSYSLTAKATDDSGVSSTSPAVAISVLESLPPPTNQTAIVSIVATDPIAIEGTNCWPWLGMTNSNCSWSNWAGSFMRYFTNCGPKNASFTVRRFGSTNEDLTVNYVIGGTATNGVNYVAVPGSVTILAGERRAIIPVVPIDDGAPDLNSTVVLKLAASPEYIVGFPGRAAALIVDSNSPRWSTGMLADRSFHLTAPGPDSAWFHVEYSTNMLDWIPLCTNQVVNGYIDFVDPDAQTDCARFYRTVPEAVPPSD